MKLKLLALAVTASLALALAACSPKASDGGSSATTQIAPDQAYSTVAAQAKGFTVGTLMSTNTVYVLFDPQCPHCGHLWNAALPLHNKVKFVWVPVAIISAKSLSQGAALLQASNPVEAMSAHEQSILTGQGGMSASASIPDDIEAAIKTNTQLLNNLGADSVPFIVARNQGTGASITQTGALETRALADFLGIAAP
jgi:thiol:disulfide interchange protein DsbG